MDGRNMPYVETIAPMQRESADALAELIERFRTTPGVMGGIPGYGQLQFEARERSVAEELRPILAKYAPWHPDASGPRASECPCG